MTYNDSMYCPLCAATVSGYQGGFWTCTGPRFGLFVACSRCPMTSEVRDGHLVDLDEKITTSDLVVPFCVNPVHPPSVILTRRDS